MITFEPRTKTKSISIDGQSYEIEFKQLKYSEKIDIDMLTTFSGEGDESNHDLAKRMLLFCELVLEKSSNIEKDSIENFIASYGLNDCIALCRKIMSFGDLEEEEKK